MKKQLALIKNDTWLSPYAQTITDRYNEVIRKKTELTGGEDKSLSDFATGHLYFGLHKTAQGWVFREWAPNATKIYLIGEFSQWQEEEQYKLSPLKNGVWEVKLPNKALTHGALYKMSVHWDGGEGERIPAWATRVVQDEISHIFSAQVWNPKEGYTFKKKSFTPKKSPLLIYECHIGMGQEKAEVGSYEEFRLAVLPRIAKSGYNTIQIMAIQEHPYYGSFGYHVSSFFAASSRFGTPEELKHLIDDAHKLGIAVIMDIVHSHAVKNEMEGLGRLDGSYNQYFYSDGRREHPAWDSLCFDYGRNEVVHFLLSNCKYWLEEYKFDGFRFDGVSSMIYYHFGYHEFSENPYDAYFGEEVNRDALLYLTLANKLIKSVKPSALSIAEDVSGMPALVAPIGDGGVGFDYRLAMAIPDFWIKYLKEVPDEDWNLYEMWEVMNSRLSDVKTITYCESHDQALVGDKTIAFRLMDSEMYWNMDKESQSVVVDRGVALHKMIRLFTITLGGNGYLNFMGNEFGHPEWIDFPREGNGWSYAHAQRKWSLVDNGFLRYGELQAFDKAMIHLVREHHVLRSGYAYNLKQDEGYKTTVYEQAGLVFVFNWHQEASTMDYEVPVPMAGEYKLILNTDDEEFGGFSRIDSSVHYFSYERDGKCYISVYNINRAALVFELV